MFENRMVDKVMQETIRNAAKRLQGNKWHEFAMDYQEECLIAINNNEDLPKIEEFSETWKKVVSV